MKKKFIIGALALTTALAFAQTGDDQAQTDRRPMFGSEITEYYDCYDTGEVMADGTSVCNCPVKVTTYIFWIGFSHTEDHFTGC